ncbi:MAG: permease [Oscillatoriales cyanobacterium RM2_1_1]|nr:permease [Oscillatoriales cyanobacterium SM2_3_0]NJO44211.1 permease [Oscillatoriales cyanobacterium RM2_1_1]
MATPLINQLNSGFTLFLSLLVEAIPFLLIGVLFSSVLLSLVDERKLLAYIPNHPLLGALFGSLVGFLFPVCECGNVPVARRLLIQGLPTSVAVGFLFAAPTINPIVIWSTWVAFRDQPEIVWLRVAFSLVIAVVLGWIFGVQQDLRPFVQPEIARMLPLPLLHSTVADAVEPPTLLTPGTYLLGQGNQPVRLESIPLWQGASGSGNVSTSSSSFKSISVSKSNFRSIFIAPSRERLTLILDNMVQEFRELGGVLVLGSAIAALIQVAVPREFILGLGQSPITSVVAMLLLGGIVSVCSTVDAFFALSFAATFTSGSLLAFLVFGPMVDIKTVGLMLSVFKTRAVVYLVILAAQMTFLLTILVNFNWS